MEGVPLGQDYGCCHHCVDYTYHMIALDILAQASASSMLAANIGAPEHPPQVVPFRSGFLARGDSSGRLQFTLNGGFSWSAGCSSRARSDQFLRISETALINRLYGLDTRAAYRR